MTIAADTAAVMVTHDGRRFLGPQCASIFRQTMLPAVLIVVDDASTDGTRRLLIDVARDAPIPVQVIHVDRSEVSDTRSRIAANVVTGLVAASGHDVIVLADQDDEWLEDRLARQRTILLEHPDALLVAGDGIIVDGSDRTTGQTLRRVYPLPPDWDSMDNAARMRAALKRPLVTGAASAITAEMAGLMRPVPDRWLHDRWATLVAAARGGLSLQTDPVIRYRVHDQQVLGLRQAQTGAGSRRWRQILERGATPVEALVRASDVVRRLGPIAIEPAVRAELTWPALFRSGLARP